MKDKPWRICAECGDREAMSYFCGKEVGFISLCPTCIKLAAVAFVNRPKVKPFEQQADHGPESLRLLKQLVKVYEHWDGSLREIDEFEAPFLSAFCEAEMFLERVKPTVVQIWDGVNSQHPGDRSSCHSMGQEEHCKTCETLCKFAGRVKAAVAASRAERAKRGSRP